MSQYPLFKRSVVCNFGRFRFCRLPVMPARTEVTFAVPPAVGVSAWWPRLRGTPRICESASPEHCDALSMGELEETDVRVAQRVCDVGPSVPGPPPSPLWAQMELAALPLRLGVHALDRVTCAAC